MADRASRSHVPAITRARKLLELAEDELEAAYAADGTLAAARMTLAGHWIALGHLEERRRPAAGRR